MLLNRDHQRYNMAVMKLAGKTAVVTGGGTGIGRAIAQSLAGEGCRVAIAGRREDPLRDAAAAWSGEVAIEFHTLDVADQQSVGSFFEWAGKTLGSINILVNSAGTNTRTRTMAEMDPADWDRIMATNASGAYYCMHAVLPQMREAGDGLIVNISSIAGLRASPLGGVAYCASKFAMTALGIAVSNEDAVHGIRVTNVYPGEVDTPILEHRPSPVSDDHRARILDADSVGQLVLAIACLPPRAHVPEVTIKPISQEFC
jgi:NAD(P)-dependent dehydrogenase (short-subunit alcohol dehydrogenase family)